MFLPETCVIGDEEDRGWPIDDVGLHTKLVIFDSSMVSIVAFDQSKSTEEKFGGHIYRKSMVQMCSPMRHRRVCSYLSTVCETSIHSHHRQLPVGPICMLEVSDVYLGDQDCCDC